MERKITSGIHLPILMGGLAAALDPLAKFTRVWSLAATGGHFTTSSNGSGGFSMLHVVNRAALILPTHADGGLRRGTSESTAFINMIAPVRGQQADEG